MLPFMLLGLVALVTTAMVEAFYGAFYLWHWIFDTPAPAYDWSTSIFVSGLATAAVLLVGGLAARLLSPETGQSTDVHLDREQRRRRAVWPA